MADSEASSVTACGISHTGNFRSNNEDWVLLGKLGGTGFSEHELDQDVHLDTAEGGVLAAVCDGLGGGAFGEVASRTSALTVGQFLADRHLEGLADPRAAFVDAIIEAHRKLVAMMTENPAFDGMGTTFSGLWWRGDEVHLAHVGDSRIYRWSRGKLEAITVDQSPVGEMLEQGRLSSEEARRHPLRNYVHQVVGGSHERIHPDLKTFRREPGALWLICSDGLTDSLADEDLNFTLGAIQHLSPVTIARKLLNQALARAGRDNVSVVIVREGDPGLFTTLTGEGRARWRAWRQKFSRTPSSLS